MEENVEVKGRRNKIQGDFRVGCNFAQTLCTTDAEGNDVEWI